MGSRFYVYIAHTSQNQVLAFEAVALLRKDCFNVCRLEDGFPEWKGKQLSGRLGRLHYRGRIAAICPLL